MILNKKNSQRLLWNSVMGCLLVACGALPTGTPSSHLPATSQISDSGHESFPWGASREEQRKLFQTLVSKKAPYTGPVELRVIPGLDQHSAHSLSLTLSQHSEFGIQSIPTGPVVFQERFTKGKQPFEVVRTFRVADTSKRYILHVQKSLDPENGIGVTANLNGIDWIKPSSFARSTQEAMQDSLLLNTNNSLRIRMAGARNASVTVSIIEAGEAGTILRKGKSVSLDDDSQAKRVARNDTNIFDPNDPGSLGALQPYEGDRVDSSGKHIGSMSINGREMLEFESGALSMDLPDAQNSLAELHNLYGAEILEQSGNHYLIKLDLSKAPLQNLPELLLAYNQSIPDNIKNIDFGSLAALQTIVLFMDITLHHANLVSDLEINGQLYPQQTAPSCSPPAVRQDWEYNDTNLGIA